MVHPFITDAGRHGTPTAHAPCAGVVSAPVWLRLTLLFAGLWLGVALVRGITFALTHAVHAL